MTDEDQNQTPLCLASVEDMAEELARRHTAVLVAVCGSWRGQDDIDMLEVRNRGPYPTTVGLCELAKAKVTAEFLEEGEDPNEIEEESE